MGSNVLDLGDVDRTMAGVVGGKGAHLGELSRIDGVNVPAGFCVTTHAFERVVTQVSALDEPFERLALLHQGDRQAIDALSAEVRGAIEATTIPDDITEAVTRSLDRLGDHAYAVRSSATAEDQPTASFAGQQDTYLNIVGAAAVLDHVRRCWASLYTERAVTYRLRNGFGHRDVRMAVVVQRMIVPQAAGVLFTADPITSNRKVASIEACFGLGEALVSGRVNADVSRVRDGEVVAATVATKRLAVLASPGGGTELRAIEPERQGQPALSDAQVVALAHLGRRVEAHFGCPQDIEWCLADDAFHLVQSRPITTLFPVPEADDRGNRVYVSVGHQQMMTDPMKALGLSLWKMTSPAAMHDAGGRLFVDVTPRLASPATSAGLIGILGRSDPLIGDALATILDRDDFVLTIPEEAATVVATAGGRVGGGDNSPSPTPIETDPTVVADLIAGSEASLAELKHNIASKSGPELLAFIRADIAELRSVLFDPHSLRVITAGMEASSWLNERLGEWLGETNAADLLTRSVPNNVTSEMGLALLDVADAIRPHPKVVAFLQRVDDDGFRDGGFLDALAAQEGGREARDAVDAYLTSYGMRCVGEIDITRPRWSERPTALVPAILGNIRNFEPGEAERRFERGRREALLAEQDLFRRLGVLPDGERKADQTKATIDRVRTFAGYREYPKYHMVSRYAVYKRALLGEAERLVRAQVLDDRDDIFHLTFDELDEVVATHRCDVRLIGARKDAFGSYRALIPPRVLTSDGETLAGVYQREGVPAGALAGLPVSAGVIEGRARVVVDLAEADLEPGDILVTTYTDPSWTPLFVAIAGLVTEVGGLMTHGAVIAREYGLPAVVGVEHATRVIGDGQRIRVNGTDGYVEVLG